MTTRPLLGAVVGAGIGLGLLLAVAGARRSERPPARPGEARCGAGWGPRPSGRAVAVAAAAAVTAVAAFLVTRWVVGALLTAAAAVTLPRAFGRRPSGILVERPEAVAGWAEMLRDTMAGAAGIEQAVVATAPLVPVAVRPHVLHLAARLRHERLGPALRSFADDVDDPAADLVVAALALAAERQARDLGGLLGKLAESARERAAMVLRVEAGRARLRTAVRVVGGFTIAFAVGMVVLNRPYLEPFDDAVGQLVLLVVGGAFAGGLWQLDRMARIPGPARILGAAPGIEP